MTQLKRFLRLSAVEEITGLKKSAIYQRISCGKFPKPVPLGDSPNSPVGWPEEEIASWQSQRLAKRDSSASNA
jgi:prophage regulatory protein